MLPGDVSLPALRVRTTEGYTGFERVKYLWYTQNISLPIFVTLEDYSIAEDGTKILLTSQSVLNTQISKSVTAIHKVDNFTYQVYPNPFKDNIKLTYSFPEKANVTVELYTSGGSKLVTLVANQEQSGTQTLSQDLSKYTQQPGVYLLKITVGDNTYTEKLVKAY
jgi:hypothetical protein